ncbi:MAG: type II toxin-antitoxin system VapC family toxin [Hormoscilla sp.]
MSRSLVAVLDASALLAYLQGEPGADRVAEVLEIGAAIGAVNWAETLTKLADHGQDPDVVATLLSNQGLLNKTLLVYPVDENIARKIAQLRQQTRSMGLSLGDRACLALASQLTLPALTTDRAWSNLNLAVQIRLIR